MAGDYHLRPEDIETLLRIDLEAKDREQRNRDLVASIEYHKQCATWERHFEQFLDLHKSRLYVALREGKILSVGKVLPSGADSSFPTDLTHEEWVAWSDAGWTRIAANNWLSSAIDWKTSQAFGAHDAHPSPNSALECLKP
jgi:hypothetical protein